MCLDSIVISAIIGFFSVMVGISGYAFQNYYVKSREREKREYRIRRRRYEELVKMPAEICHITQTRNEKTSLDLKKQMDEVTNRLHLYASGDVIRSLKVFVAKNEDEEFRNLIFALGKDLNMKADLTASEIQWSRAT